MAKAQPVAELKPAARKLKIVTVAQHKGGVGKTTWVRILAEYFATVRGIRVLLLDLDPQCNLSQRFLEMDNDPLSPEGVLPPIHPDYDVKHDRDWAGRSSIADIFYGRLMVPYPTYITGIDMLPGNGQDLRLVEQQRPAEIKERVLNRLNEFLLTPEVQQAYDIVIVDTPPSKGPLTQSALRASTHVLIPMVLEPQSQEGLVGMLAFWRAERRVRTPDNPLNILGILPNMYRRVALHAGVLEALRRDEVLAEYVLPFEVSQRVAFAESDHWAARPKSVLQLSITDEARREAELVCRHIEGEVFGNVTE